MCDDDKNRIDRIDDCTDSIQNCHDVGEFCLYLDEVYEKSKTIDAPFAYLAKRAFQLNEVAEDKRFKHAVHLLRKHLSIGCIDSVLEHYTKNQVRLRLAVTSIVDSEKQTRAG